MELRQLRYFVTVATERNFTRAAARLGIAQPPLSRQIRWLEERLGVALFDRQARPLALTEAGRLLYDQALQLLARASQLEVLMRRQRDRGRRRFIIGFVGSTIYGPMPSLIRRFRAAAPQVELSMREMTTVAQVTALKDRRIDVGIGRIRIDDAALRRDLLVEERIIAALPASHPLAKRARAPVSIKELTSDTLIIYPLEPRPSYADYVLSLFRDQGCDPGSVHEVRDLQAAIGMVAAEAGISLVPDSVRHLRRKDIAYRALAERGAVSPILLSWREADQSEEVALLRDIARKTLGGKADRSA
jgi:DNA-binding transcriptional LysR family regulator